MSRELLEAAAKAAGIPWVDGAPSRMGWANWNPLTDDGDAFRLAVKLRMTIMIHTELDPGKVFVSDGQDGEAFELHGSDLAAATRLAIVRAAAAIGGAK